MLPEAEQGEGRQKALLSSRPRRSASGGEIFKIRPAFHWQLQLGKIRVVQDRKNVFEIANLKARWVRFNSI